MENGIPLIKKFRTEKNYYVYDTWTNEILNVHKDFWNYLPDADHPHFDEKTSNQISNLAEVQSEVEKAQRLGYLSTERPEVATYHGWPNWKEEIAFQINHNLQQLSLNVTEVCNFRCQYCAYSGLYKGNRTHSLKQMPWPIAEKAIEYAIQHSDYGAEKNLPLAISFYGGEPLCNFEIIKKSVSFCKEKFPHRNIRFNMTTNGSLINEEIANFLVENDFNLVFSIDGPDYLHDRYRRTISGKPTHSMTMRGYYLIKKIVAAKHKKIYISVNCVIPPPFDFFAIEEFAKSLEDEIRLTQPSILNTTFYDQFDVSTEKKKYKFQSNRYFQIYKNDLVTGKIRDRNLIGKALCERELVFLQKRKMTRMQSKIASDGQCVPGARKLFVSSDGFFYPCEKVVEQYRIGHIDTGIDFFTLYRLLESYSKFLSNTCASCWALRLCIKCFANFAPSNDFKNNVLREFCYISRANIERNLLNYCSILESNPYGFDFAKDMVMM